MSSVNHCLLCYKEGDSEFTLVTDSTGEGRRLVENEETSRKFLLLSCRYLNLDTNQIFPESQAFSGLSTLKQVCDGCFPLLESFCEMYEKWQLLQFEMNHKLEQIQKIMKQSDEDSTSHRKSWKTKLEKLNIASTSVDKFRSKFTGESKILLYSNKHHHRSIANIFYHEIRFMIFTLQLSGKERTCHRSRWLRWWNQFLASPHPDPQQHFTYYRIHPRLKWM